MLCKVRGAWLSAQGTVLRRRNSECCTTLNEPFRRVKLKLHHLFRFVVDLLYNKSTTNRKKWSLSFSIATSVGTPAFVLTPVMSSFFLDTSAHKAMLYKFNEFRGVYRPPYWHWSMQSPSPQLRSIEEVSSLPFGCM